MHLVMLDSLSREDQLHTASNFLRRTMLSPKKRRAAFSQLTEKDIEFSYKAARLVSETLADIDEDEIRLGLLSIESHLQNLHARDIYLTIFAAMIPILYLVEKSFGLDAVIFYMSSLAVILCLTDRVFISLHISTLKHLQNHINAVLSGKNN